MLYKCQKDYWCGDVHVMSLGDRLEIEGDFLKNLTTGVTITGNAILDLMDRVEPIYNERNTLNTNVNHPKHYTQHPSGIECITITRHYCFDIGNAIKYLWRAGLKGDASMTNSEKEIEDLEKAIWYINDRINELKNAGRLQTLATY